MKYILIIITTLLFLSGINEINAQQRIDNLIDKMSTTSDMKLTSTITREPKTRKIKMVLKKLEMSYSFSYGNIFKQAFKDETNNASYSKVIADDKENSIYKQTLIFKKKEYSSIYELDYSSGGSMTVTIVHKYN